MQWWLGGGRRGSGEAGGTSTVAGRMEELPFLLSFASLAVAGGGGLQLLQGLLAVFGCGLP